MKCSSEVKPFTRACSTTCARNCFATSASNSRSRFLVNTVASHTSSSKFNPTNQRGSSDGGALLLKAADRRYGLIGCLAGCLRDERQAGKVDHSLKELLAQRVFSIACGYPDANDAARLAADPIHKMLLDRDPGAGRDLVFAADAVAL